ncbi:hypothetical protein ACFPM0_06135 [Pseudonocardia sulfidoxydans]|uniref:hypothetical protein n=1 Tax=Pseudonocardia sulfidoxydans TaxID=54011 RepID=UPI00360BE808
MSAPTLASPGSLPPLVLGQIAEQIADALTGHDAGNCVRIDSIRRGDAGELVEVLRDRLPAGLADVHVLVDHPGDADGKLAIPAERAVELRNRKERQLVLMVPVGSGSAASSLDNSFARIDVTRLLAKAAELLVASITDAELQAGVRQVARELGRGRPVEAWARYVAAVVADASWATLGTALWMVGLVPDLGGPELLKRLSRNAACARAVSRPVRAVASVADRLTAAELQEGDERDRIARYLARPEIDLSDAPSWAEPLALPPHDLTFDLWPLVERRTVEVGSVRIDPFLKEDGTLRAGTRLNQENPGDLPYVETGPDTPATVTVVWRTDPPKADTVDRWLVEALPPADLRDVDGEPVARQTVKGDKRRATVRLDIAEEDLADGALLVLRLTGIDADGQPVLLRSGDEAVDESQQFGVRWEQDPVVGPTRRASTPSLAQARLDAALEGAERPRRGRSELERRRVLGAARRAAHRAARTEPGIDGVAGQAAARTRSRRRVGGRWAARGRRRRRKPAACGGRVAAGVRRPATAPVREARRPPSTVRGRDPGVGRRPAGRGVRLLPGLPACPGHRGRRHRANVVAGARHRPAVDRHRRQQPDRRDDRAAVAAPASGLDRRVRPHAGRVGAGAHDSRPVGGETEAVRRRAAHPPGHAGKPSLRHVRRHGDGLRLRPRGDARHRRVPGPVRAGTGRRRAGGPRGAGSGPARCRGGRATVDRRRADRRLPVGERRTGRVADPRAQRGVGRAARPGPRRIRAA